SVSSMISPPLWAPFGRIPGLLPFVERGVYRVAGMAAAPRAKVGADVLPWGPLQGAYLLVEQGEAEPSTLISVPGVAGVWSGATTKGDDSSTVDGLSLSTADMGLQVTYCFLDDDPVAAAEQLRGALDKRWSATGVDPLLAAPFHPVGGDDCTRYLP